MANRLHTLLADAREIVALVDPSGYVTPLGSGAEQHLTFPSAHRTVLWELVHPDDVRPVQAALRQVFTRSEREAVKFQVQDPHGNWHTLDAMLRLLEDTAPPQALLDATDITEPHAIESASRDQAQLQQSGRLEVLGRLAGGISHDFGNLLTVIVGDIGRVLEGLPTDSPLRAPAESVRTAAERAGGMVRRLLAFSRPQSSTPAVIDLNALISESEELLRRLVGEQVALRITTCAGLWPVRADRTQVEQVLFNLAVNARDAMPAGGELRIDTRNLGADDLPKDTTEPVAGCAAISVTDVGTGMDEPTQARAFEPYFTTKPSGRGTGLGLATVREILVENGGWVHLTSCPGSGTTVTFGLPRAHGAVSLPAIESAAEGGTETLLVVEDEPRVRELVADMLSEAGYDVLGAAAPADAEQIARDRSGEIHLLLTDVVMPGMSGFDLSARLQAHRPGLRVVYMSGYPKPMFAERHGEMPGTHFIAKPFDRQSLLRSIRQALDAADAH